MWANIKLYELSLHSILIKYIIKSVQITNPPKLQAPQT